MEGVDSILRTGSLGIPQHQRKGTETTLARNRFRENHSPSCVACGHFQAAWVAYFQAHNSTLLIDNGENVKVVQELMRHASSHFTLQTYSQAHIRTKRAAQRRVVEELLAEGHQDSMLIPVVGDKLVGLTGLSHAPEEAGIGARWSKRMFSHRG